MKRLEEEEIKRKDTAPAFTFFYTLLEHITPLPRASLTHTAIYNVPTTSLLVFVCLLSVQPLKKRKE